MTAPLEASRLLGLGDPPPVKVSCQAGASPFLMLGDHAGRRIPTSLGGLGLPAEAMERHIAWDIGVAGLGALLSPALDAVFISQVYSRLVIDCNRRPGSDGSMPEISDGIAIPGNQKLDPAEVAARIAEIYDPYQDRIAGIISERVRLGQPTVLVSLHSFTPTLQGQARPWRYGVLHRGDSAVSRRMLAQLRALMGDEAGDNQPYAMDGVDNTIPLHADPRGLDYLELEVRQDLIADAEGQAAAADLIAGCLRAVLGP